MAGSKDLDRKKLRNDALIQQVSDKNARFLEDLKARTSFDYHMDKLDMAEQMEAQRAKESGQTITKTPQYSAPAKIGPGGDGAMDGIEGHGLSLAGLVGGGGQQGPGSTTTSAVSEDGRTMTDTRTTNNPTNLLQGRLGPLNLIPGLSEMFTKDNISTDTVTSPNPAHAEKLENITNDLATMQHSARLGKTSEADYIRTAMEQTKFMNESEKQQFAVNLKRQSAILQTQQAETDTNEAITLSGQLAKDGVLTPGLALQGSRAETPEQVEAWGMAVQNAYKNSPKELRNERVAVMEEKRARLLLDGAQNKFDDDNKARKLNEAELEREGVFKNAGSFPTLTSKQIVDGQEKTWYSSDDGSRVLNLQADQIPTYSKYVEAELALGQTMNMPIPDIKGTKGSYPEGSWGQKQGEVFQLDPDELYMHVANVSDLWYTKDGNRTTDNSEIDFDRTEEERQQSYEWLNLNGFNAIEDDTGVPLIDIATNFPYPAQAAKALNIARGTLVAGKKRGALYESIKDFQGTGVETTSVGPKQGTSDSTPPSREFMAGVIEAANEAEKQKRREATHQGLQDAVNRGMGFNR